MRRLRLPVALLAVFSLGLTEGCAARMNPRPTVLPPGEFVEISGGGSPLSVIFSVPDGAFPHATCRATLVRGYSTGRRGDEISLAWVSFVQPVTPNDSLCVPNEAARVIGSPAMSVRLHNNLSRAAVAGIAVVGIAIIIYFISKSKSSVY